MRSQTDILAVHSLDSFAISVSSLEEAFRFYATFGLDVREKDGGLEVRASGSDHIWMLISQADLPQGKKRLDHISFGVFPDELPRFAEHLRAEGIETCAGADRPNEGLWFRNPDGLLVEIKVAAKTTLATKAALEFHSAKDGERGAGLRRSVEAVKPRRLAHIALFTTDVRGAIAFYQRALGLRLSDASGDDVAFLHAPHGSDHHLIALARSTHAGLHHCSWDVPSVQAVGLGAMQMQHAGYERGWGVGRHVLGSNYFYYAQDPWGSFCEYTADMDFIPSGLDWSAGEHDHEDAFYLWGPLPPAELGVNNDMV